MYHRNYTTYLQKELDFLKMLVSRFHEQEKVNGLELDVALQKMQEVYEQLLRIKLLPEEGIDERKTASPKPEPKPEPKPQPVVVEVEISVPVEDSVPKNIVVEQEKKIEKEEPPKIAIVEQLPVREEKKQQVDSAKSTILAEKISPSDFHPINETLAQKKTGNDLSSKLQTAPLSSISSGIGLNDKFLFIRELFKGDNVLYNNTIQHLDAADSLANAMDFIQHHIDWDENNETTQKFINLIHRRHGSS